MKRLGSGRISIRAGGFAAFFAAFITVLLLSLEVMAQVEMSLFDFDGTLVENRQARDGTMNPPVILFRNDQRLNLIQSEATGPRQIFISQQDLHKISEFLGTGEGRPGAVNREVELADGTKIKPGEYYIRLPDSFQYFREGPPGQNFLLLSFRDAFEKGARGAWKGPMWDIFAGLCETEKGAESVGIITARGHSRQEWDELFDYMKTKGLIRFKPNVRRVFSMSRSEFDRYSGGGGAFGRDQADMSVRKANLIDEMLTQLVRVNLPDGELHSFMYADDEPAILERVAGVFRKIAFGSHTPVRMTLANSGLKSQIRASALPEFAVIEPNDSVFRTGHREALLPKAAMIKADGPTCRLLFAEAL